MKEFEPINTNNKDGKQYSTDGAVCPYCGYIHEPCNVDYVIYDEDCDTFDCYNCGKTFNTSVYTSHSWTTTKIT